MHTNQCIFQITELFIYLSNQTRNIIKKLAMLCVQLSGYNQQCVRILSLVYYLIKCVQNEKIQLLTAIFRNVYKNRGTQIFKWFRFLLMTDKVDCFPLTLFSVFWPFELCFVVHTAAYKSHQLRRLEC